MNFSDAKTVITWIVESGGAGVVSFWLLSQFEKTGMLKDWNGEWKRVLSIVFAVILGTLVAWLGGVVRLYAVPTDAAGWLDMAIKVGGVTALSHQLTHGFTELPKKRAAAAAGADKPAPKPAKPARKPKKSKKK